MMSLLDIIFLAIALAMDCFSISIVSGIILRDEEGVTRPAVSMALLFGLFQALMPLIGWTSTTWAAGGSSLLARYCSLLGHFAAFLLLAFIGGRMVWESLRPAEHRHFNPRRLPTQLLLAVATSIDALAVGVTFALTGRQQWEQMSLPLIIIGIASLVLSLLGHHLGRHFGRVIERRLKPELLGGIILIGIGVKILIMN